MTTLFDPFPREAVSWRAQSLSKLGDKAMALAYIDARDVMNRLDEVCGPHGWQDSYVETASGRVICTLSIADMDNQGKTVWIAKSDGAGSTDVEGDKGGISDAFKRAAVKWGIGRYLYDLDAPWVPCESYEASNGKKVWKRWTSDPWGHVKNAPKPPKAEMPEGPHKTKTALDTAITAFCTHISALTTSDDLEAFVTEQHPTLAQYRAAYGRDSDHVAAITQQIANARTRVAARAELPADEGPVAGSEPFEWPESVQRLVSQIGTRETTKALETWVALPATKAIMATLDPVELQYVRGAYSDRAKAINAMEVSGA